jgi:hypothetical protein
LSASKITEFFSSRILRLLNNANERIWAPLEGEYIAAADDHAVDHADGLMSEDESDGEIKVYEQPDAPERRLSPRENRRKPDFFQSPM